jgi:diaminopimelate decarboxylase
MRQVAEFAGELVASGHRINVIDVGGGLGVRYRHGHDQPLPVDEYAAMLRAVFAEFDGTLVLEPGRYLVAEAGVLITRVIRIKQGPTREFLVVDAAMNDLQRPAMYDAWHEIVPLHEHGGGDTRYDVVGPVCETGDTFAVQRPMPRCLAGDLLLIANAGAYGASMSSNYNSRPLTAEVMLDRGRHAVVRRRQSFDEMIAGESLAAEWQTA